MLLEVFPVGHYHGGIGSTSRTIPRQPVPCLLRFFWTGEWHTILRGDTGIAWGIWAMVNLAPFVADNGKGQFIAAWRDAEGRLAAWLAVVAGTLSFDTPSPRWDWLRINPQPPLRYSGLASQLFQSGLVWRILPIPRRHL